jgi:hypothetical protein
VTPIERGSNSPYTVTHPVSREAAQSTSGKVAEGMARENVGPEGDGIAGDERRAEPQTDPARLPERHD